MCEVLPGVPMFTAVNFSTPGGNPGKDRPVTAREFGNPGGVSRLVIWSRLTRLLFTRAASRRHRSKKKKRKEKGIQHRRAIRGRIGCPHSLRLRIHMHTQVSSQHMH
jgi:hypothetical protein